MLQEASLLILYHQSPWNPGPQTPSPLSLSARGRRVAHFMTSRGRSPPVSHHQAVVAWISTHSPQPWSLSTPSTSAGGNAEQKVKGQARGTLPGMQVALTVCSLLSLSQAQACPGSSTATGSEAFGIPEPPSQKSLTSSWHTEGTEGMLVEWTPGLTLECPSFSALPRRPLMFPSSSSSHAPSSRQPSLIPGCKVRLYSLCWVFSFPVGPWVSCLGLKHAIRHPWAPVLALPVWFWGSYTSFLRGFSSDWWE